VKIERHKLSREDAISRLVGVKREDLEIALKIEMENYQDEVEDLDNADLAKKFSGEVEIVN
jgi:hypothetical protein